MELISHYRSHFVFQLYNIALEFGALGMTSVQNATKGRPQWENPRTEGQRLGWGCASTQAEAEPGSGSGQPNQEPAWPPLAGPLSEHRRLAEGVELDWDQVKTEKVGARWGFTLWIE